MSKRRNHRRALLAAALVAALSAAALAQTARAMAQDREMFEHGVDDGYPAWFLPSGTSREEAEALRSRWAAIKEELGAGGCAVTYFSGGEMRQRFLRWAPGAGFVYFYVYENFSVIDFSYGKVTVTPSEVVFTVEREQREVDARGTPSVTPRRWVVARLKGRAYMLPAQHVADFGEYVGGFGRYKDFNGSCCEFVPFLVGGCEAARAAALPEVPAEYRRFIRRPVEATVTAVGRRRIKKGYGYAGELYSRHYERASLTPVRIDAGRKQGVRPGLLFRLVGVPDGYQYLEITRVGPSSAEGFVVRDLEDDGRETFYDFTGGAPVERVLPPVAVGTKVTTSPRTLE